MLWAAAVSVPVEHAAVRVLPLPETATAPQPAIDVPPSVKFTEPVGLLPLIVAVNVTVEATIAGFAELASVVVVAAPPPVVTLTVKALALAPVTMMFTP